MKKLTFRHVVMAVGLLASMACFGGSSEDGVILTSPTVGMFRPCKAAVGEDVVIQGSRFFATQGTGYVRINGQQCPVKSWSDTVIKITVPPGATTGPLSVANSDALGDTGDTFEVGTRTPVAEHEPNDAVDGSNATDTKRDQAGAGTLSSVADKDHFKIRCIIPSEWYTLTLTPRVVGVIYLDGVARTLNAAGTLQINGSDVKGSYLLVGLTGGTGFYTLKVE